MALNAVAVLEGAGELGGWTLPKSYKGGSFVPRDGGDAIAFEPGVSMRVCLLSAEQDFTVLKVKTANVGKVHSVLEKLARGARILVSYTVRDGQFEMVSCSAAVKV